MPSLTNMPLIISVKPFSGPNQPDDKPHTNQTTDDNQNFSAIKGSSTNSPYGDLPLLKGKPPNESLSKQNSKFVNISKNCTGFPPSQNSPKPQFPDAMSSRNTARKSFPSISNSHFTRSSSSPNKSSSTLQKAVPNPVTILSSPPYNSTPYSEVEITENDDSSSHSLSSTEFIPQQKSKASPDNFFSGNYSSATRPLVEKEFETHSHTKSTQTPSNAILSSNENERKGMRKRKGKVKKMFSCNECGKGFQQYKNLRRHVKERHPMELDQLAPSMRRLSDSSSAYACDICKKYFSEMSTLQRHAKNFHGYSTTRAIPCSLCGFIGGSCKTLVQHLENDHHINVVRETLIFANKEEFLIWKEDIERSSYVRYVKYCGSRKNENNTLEYFHCHRSGIYVPRGEGKRNMKFQGSNKINGYCPSKMTVTYTKNKVTVIFIKTHVGHQGEIERITLTHKERTYLAEKIAQNIPFSEILKEVRGSISDPENLSRLHLLKRKDLHNIKREFDLQSSNLVHNDTTLQEWVDELNRGEDSPILYFKPKGHEDEPFDSLHLNRDDFFLAIMNDLQSETLLEYGRNIVCVDTIHRPDSKSFDITTLIVVDGRNHGFPGAFLISNKTDQRFLYIFFKLIEEKVGSLSPNIFMSNIDKYYYTAWTSIMGTPNHWLFCTWNVDFVWTKNLYRIQNQEKQYLAYKIIRMTLEEKDKRTFLSILQQAMSALLDDDLMVDFGVYFKENFGENYESWAYSFSKDILDGSAQIHVERMHNTIKCIYLEGNKNKRLDSAMNTIMRFVRDDLYNSLTALPLERLDHKFLAWRNAHESGQALTNHFKIVSLDGKSWNVSSPSTGELYYIKELNAECSCPLKCEGCGTCVHNYSCDCFDSSIHWNMCKHIHLIGQHVRGPIQPTSFSSCADQEQTSQLGFQSQGTVPDGHPLDANRPQKILKGQNDITSTEAVEPLLALSFASPSYESPSSFQEETFYPPFSKRQRITEEPLVARQPFQTLSKNTARKSFSSQRR